MLLHSYLYRQFYPFERSTEIQQLDDRDREKLSKCIRDFPRIINYWKIDAALNAAKGRLGSTSYFDISGEELRPAFDALAEKVQKRQGLTEEEVLGVNLALCAHKYNWFWRMYFHPTRDIVELIQKHNAIKREGS